MLARKIIAALAFSIPAAIPVSAAHSIQPAVGDIYDLAQGEQFRGWTLNGYGLTDSRNSDSYAIFTRGDSRAIAGVQFVAQGRDGQHTVNRILRIIITRAGPGEVEVEGDYCQFLSLMPAVAFYSASTRTARGIFVLPGEIRTMRWFVDEEHTCEYGGD